MTLQAASQLSLPPTPHSLVTPHTATTKITSSTSGHSTSPTLSGTNIRSIDRNTRTERPPGGCYLLLLVCACCHKSASRLHFAQISRVSLFHHVLHDDQLTTSSGAHIVQRASFNRRQPMMWRERPPLKTAEVPPGATRLKICVRTLLYVDLQRISGVAPPRQRTNAG